MREEERAFYECFAENKPIPDNYDVSNLDNAHDHIKASSHEDSVVHESGANLFEDLGLPDAGAHFLKAQIVAELYRLVTERGLNQTDAAAVMGISQPEVSRFFRGNLREYSVDRLMAFLTAFDQDVEIVSRPRNRAAGDARGKIVFKAAAA